MAVTAALAISTLTACGKTDKKETTASTAATTASTASTAATTASTEAKTEAKAERLRIHLLQQLSLRQMPRLLYLEALQLMVLLLWRR